MLQVGIKLHVVSIMTNVVEIDKDSDVNYIKSIIKELVEFEDLEAIVVAVKTKDNYLKCQWCGSTVDLLGLSTHLSNSIGEEVLYD